VPEELRTTKLHQPDVTGVADIDSVPDWTEVIPLWVPAFFGDSNRLLKAVQRHTYTSLVYALFRSARRRYLDACDLLGVETDFSVRLEETVIPAMPYLGRVYRKVAAFYRSALDPGVRYERDSGQSAEQLRADWEAFFCCEAAWMAGRDDAARAVLESAASPERAVDAEELLLGELRRRYGVMTLRRRAGIRRQLDRRHGGMWPEPTSVESTASDQVRPNPPD
jgi:hypothetical protein